jgi:hypothetical protein
MAKSVQQDDHRTQLCIFHHCNSRRHHKAVDKGGSMAWMAFDDPPPEKNVNH